ncbi:MAG: MBL fold metallo-hydrolase [Candidatus Heimdallarchaeota archaeon]|nr:MBL fold metallo-hydrolase [Candidatus Heimdallarchaeota archaeon]MCK4955466.1 MBL fold metallo-hydrolase [Candidatus Heimdallarchaeota archaeon]
MFELEQVSENVWAHTKGETRGNVAFIKLGDTVIMIDSGMDPITADIAKNSAEEIIGFPISKLVLTHHHPDHILGNQIFEESEIISTNSINELMKEVIKKYYAPEKLAQYKADDPVWEEKWKDLRFVFPTTTFDEEYFLENQEERIELIETNGHTRGSTFIYVPKDNVIIAGDILFAEVYPYGGDPSMDPYLWISAYQKMIDLRPDKVVPGHGPVSSIKELKLHKEYLSELVQRIEDLIEAGITKEELLKRADLPVFPYEITSPERLETMLDRCYEVIKEAIESY